MLPVKSFEYRIISAEKSEMLEKKISDLSELGWICQGGVYADQPFGGGYFYQAMIKYHEQI